MEQSKEAKTADNTKKRKLWAEKRNKSREFFLV